MDMDMAERVGVQWVSKFSPVKGCSHGVGFGVASWMAFPSLGDEQ